MRSKAVEPSPKETANTMWGMGRPQQQDKLLALALSQTALALLSSAPYQPRPQNPANGFRATGKPKTADLPSVAAPCRSAAAVAGQFRPQESANFVWGSGTPSHRGAALGAATDAAFLGGFNVQEPTNGMRAAGVLQPPRGEVLSVARARVPELAARYPASLARCCGRPSAQGPATVQSTAALARQRLGTCGSQDPANLAQALGKLLLVDKQLFAELSDRAQEILQTLKALEISSVAWASTTCATAGEKSSAASGAEMRRREHVPRSLAGMLWMFATVLWRGASWVLEALAVHEPSPQSVASAVRCAARLSVELPRSHLLAVSQKLCQLGPQELTNRGWAPATLLPREVRLLDAIFQRLWGLLEDCKVQEPASAAQASAVAQHRDEALLLATLG
ncbi:unnamed protein product [Effrenium voratum]|nr:unnamed protein product [Effrenium voratum]